MIAANVSFLLCSRPSFDSTLGGDRIDYSRIVFGVHERHWASAKRVATIVEPKGMFADPLVDRPPRDSRIVAAVCATQNVDRRAIQEPVPLELVAHPIIEAKSLQLGGGLTGAPESCPSRRAFGAPQDEGDLRSGPRSLRQEKAHHDAGGVEAYALGKAAVRIAAEPGVPAAFDHCSATDWPSASFRDVWLTRPPSIGQPTASDSTKLQSALTPAPRRSAP